MTKCNSRIIIGYLYISERVYKLSNTFFYSLYEIKVMQLKYFFHSLLFTQGFENISARNLGLDMSHNKIFDLDNSRKLPTVVYLSIPNLRDKNLNINFHSFYILSIKTEILNCLNTSVLLIMNTFVTKNLNIMHFLLISILN